jgi:polysaccharide export outer membrane protein
MNAAQQNVVVRSARMRIWLVVFAIALVACRDNPPLVYPTKPVEFDSTRLPLGPGDKLELTIFFGSKQERATYTLDAGGQISVQFIGTVSAAGKTTVDIQDDIQKRLADGYLKDPIVSLTVVEINSLKLSVSGQVVHNGSVKFTPGMTITEVIALSGGFSPLARKNRVKLTRIVSGKEETWDIPVEMIGEGRRPNCPMMPGDRVFVPERPI